MTLEHAIALQEKSWSLLGRGKIQEAHKCITDALRLFEAFEGKDSPDVANLLNDLADIEDRLERFDDALAHATRRMKITDALGRGFTGDDAVMIRARSRSLIGTIHRQMGDYKTAELFLKEALKMNKRHFGEAHPEVATSENNLAIVYKYSGQFTKGLALYRAALAKLIAEFGEDALPLSSIYHNIGGILHACGKYEEAEAPGRRAWEISKLHLGASHPQSVADAAAYAGILDGLGRYKESEPIYLRAIKRFEKLYGPENYEVAVNLNNLAALKAAQGKHTESEALYRKSLAMTVKLFGRNHPDVALALNNLASLLNEMGRPRQAVKLYERALRIFEKHLKPSHPKVKLVKENLAATRKRIN